MQANDLEDLEERPLSPSEKKQLQQVTSLVDAAYRNVEHLASQRQRSVSSGSQKLSISTRSDVLDTSISHSPFYPASPEVYSTEKANTTELRASVGSRSSSGSEAFTKDEDFNELLKLPKTLESALHVNQVLQTKFQNVLYRLQKTLDANKTSQATVVAKLEELRLEREMEKELKDSSKYYLRATSFCVPYFKIRSSFCSAPRNEDGRYKVDNGYIDLYTVKNRVWSSFDKENFTAVVQQAWKDKVVEIWQSKCQDLTWKIKLLKSGSALNFQENEKDLQKKLKECEHKKQLFSNVPSHKFEMEFCCDLDWDQIAAAAFDGNRTGDECKLMWENYLHPDINKKPWTEEEDISIEKLVELDNKNPNWNLIAKNMNTNRAPFMVFSRYVSFIKPALYPTPWTEKAKEKLSNAVNVFTIGNVIPWNIIHQQLNGYSRTEIIAKWRSINPAVIKGYYSRDENILLIKGLYKFGLNIALIASHIPGRTQSQVREKFKHSILPFLTTNPFTRKEDEKIIQYYKSNPRGSRAFAKRSCNKRSLAIVGTRYYTILVWKELFESNELPPPMFPLSVTTDLHEVEKLRHELLAIKFLGCSKNLLSCTKIDAPSTKISILNDANREAAPSKIPLLQDCNSDSKRREKKKKFVRTRNNFVSWPDQCLTSFFLSYRFTRPFNLEDNEKGAEAFKMLCSTFKLNPSHERLKDFPYAEDSMKLQEATLVSLFASQGQEDKGTLRQSYWNIPLVPPCSTTVGGLMSMLFHRSTLTEMAQRKFILYNLSKAEVRKLGSVQDQKKVMDMKYKTSAPNTGKIHITTLSKTSNKNKIGKDLIGRQTKETANEADYVQIHKGAQPFQLRIKTSDTHSAVISKEQDAKKKLSEELLYQRFISLFFWPSVMTKLCPPDAEYKKLEKGVSKKSVVHYRDPFKLSSEDVQSRRKFKGKLPFLDIKEQEKLLEEFSTKIMTIKRGRKHVNSNQVEGLPSCMSPSNSSEGHGQEHSLSGSSSSQDADDNQQLIVNGQIKSFGCCHKRIVTLKRSLTMKKTWELRKKGLLTPPRKRGLSKKKNSECQLRSSRRSSQRLGNASGELSVSATSYEKEKIHINSDEQPGKSKASVIDKPLSSLSESNQFAEKEKPDAQRGVKRTSDKVKLPQKRSKAK